MPISPYLFFDGRCEEAINFYRDELGAKLEMMMRFKDSPVPHDESCGPPPPPESVMHAEINLHGVRLLVSDGRSTGQPKFEGFSLALNVKSEQEAEQLFHKLARGGQVQMPLMATFWSPKFGMVADKFGVSWMVMADPAQQQ